MWISKYVLESLIKKIVKDELERAERWSSSAATGIKKAVQETIDYQLTCNIRQATADYLNEVCIDEIIERINRKQLAK